MNLHFHWRAKQMLHPLKWTVSFQIPTFHPQVDTKHAVSKQNSRSSFRKQSLQLTVTNYIKHKLSTPNLYPTTE